MFKITLAITAVMVALSGNLAAADKGTVLVAGAGKSGKPLIKILVDQGYKVRVLTREAADLGNGVTVVVGDVTKPATLAPAVKGVDFVVSTIGAGAPQGDNRPEVVDFKGVANLVDAAKAASLPGRSATRPPKAAVAVAPPSGRPNGWQRPPPAPSD